MSNTAKSKKRFIVTSVVSLNSVEALLALAERAYAVRDYNRVMELGESLLLSGPPVYRSIGSYYYGLGGFRNGDGDVETAFTHYQRALSHAPAHYRQRIFVSLAILLYHQREYEKAVRAFEQIARLDDLSAVTEARRALAIFDSLEGKHERAAQRLESLYNMVKGKDSLLHLPFEVANSWAVELETLGKLSEAKPLIDEVITSPFAYNQPEWHKTADVINRKCSRPSAFPVRFDEARLIGDAWRQFDEFIEAHKAQFTLQNVLDLKEEAWRIVA